MCITHTERDKTYVVYIISMFQQNSGTEYRNFVVVKFLLNYESYTTVCMELFIKGFFIVPLKTSLVGRKGGQLS